LGVTPPPRTFAGLSYNNTGSAGLDTIVTLLLTGNDSPNYFTVIPSTVTAFTMDARLPVSIIPGDFLLVDARLLPKPAARLHTGNTAGQGYWDFIDGQAVLAEPVSFVSIERTRARQHP
jgi:hypothetical protein